MITTGVFIVLLAVWLWSIFRFMVNVDRSLRSFGDGPFSQEIWIAWTERRARAKERGYLWLGVWGVLGMPVFGLGLVVASCAHLTCQIP